MNLLRSLLFLLLTFSASAVFADITFDAGSVDSGSGSTINSTVHTIGAGSNTLLVVGLGTGSGTPTVSSITWNGVALTPGPSNEYWAGNYEIQMFYLAGADVGNQTLSISLASSTSYNLSIVSYHGVDQSNPVTANSNDAAGYGTDISVTVSNVTDGNMVVDVWQAVFIGTMTAVGPNQTARAVGASVGSSESTSSGSVLMDWDGTNGTDWGIAAQEFVAAGEEAGPPVFLLRRRGR